MVFNIRNESWHIGFETENGNIEYLKVVYDFPLLKQYKYLFPELPGDFIVQKTENFTGDDIDYTNIGDSFALYYYTQDEIEEWVENNDVGW